MVLGNGVIRKPDATAVYQEKEGKIALTMADGKVTGWAASADAIVPRVRSWRGGFSKRPAGSPDGSCPRGPQCQLLAASSSGNMMRSESPSAAMPC
jgi:hypothetical protein